MTQRELKRKLKTTLRDADIPVRREHMELTKALVKNGPPRFTGRERIGLAQFLYMQIRFIGWKIWAMQGALLVALRLFLAASMGAYYMENPRYAALALCCLSVLVLMTSLPFIHRSVRYKMHETEAATRFSSLRLLMAKLLLVGAGDVLMLACLLCVAVRKTTLSAGSAALYLLFPFLLAGCGLLFLLNRIPPARFAAGGAVVCFLLVGAFSLLAGVCPAFYQQTFSVGWAAACVLLACMCAFRLRQIVHRCPYAEMQLV